MIRLVEAGNYFTNALKLVDSVQKLQPKLEAVAQAYAVRASEEGNASVDGDVDRVPGCQLGCSDSQHVRAAAETLSEKQHVGVTPELDRKRTDNRR